MKERLVGTAVLVLLAFAPTATAQNLAVNGEFDTNTDGWEPLANPSLTVDWSSLDRADNPESGSLLATNTASGAANLAIVFCVDTIPDGTPYQYSGFVRVPTGQNASGSVTLFFYWYDSPSCSGTQIEVAAIPSVIAGDSWTYVSSAPTLAPDGTQSAWLVLGIYKESGAPGTFQAHVDGLDFRATLFRDSFESGDGEFWSDSVGFPPPP